MIKQRLEAGKRKSSVSKENSWGLKKKKKRISKPKSSMEAVKSEQRTDTEK